MHKAVNGADSGQKNYGCYLELFFSMQSLKKYECNFESARGETSSETKSLE
jgi:hypothetical protein